MNARRPFQFSLRDLLLLTLFVAVCAWSLRVSEGAASPFSLLVLHATALVHGMTWLAVFRDIRSGKRGGEHETAKAYMAFTGALPWLAWLVVATILGVHEAQFVDHRGPDGIHDTAMAILLFVLVPASIWSLGSIGYCMGANLPSRYLWLAGLNIALAVMVLAGLMPPIEAARE